MEVNGPFNEIHGVYPGPLKKHGPVLSKSADAFLIAECNFEHQDPEEQFAVPMGEVSGGKVLHNCYAGETGNSYHVFIDRDHVYVWAESASGIHIWTKTFDVPTSLRFSKSGACHLMNDIFHHLEDRLKQARQ